MEGHRLPPAPRLADENNYLSRDSKMSSTGLASVGITRPAEKGAPVPRTSATRVSVATFFQASMSNDLEITIS
jgi:hypothetical protein